MPEYALEGNALIEVKPLKGVWWKYGLLFASLMVGAWLMLGYRVNPDFTIVLAAQRGVYVYGAFILMGFLPFAFGRFGLKRLMWFALIGILLGQIGYHLLANFPVTRQFNLLPFITFLQMTFAGLSLGVVWELGRYVFKKVAER